MPEIVTPAGARLAPVAGDFLAGPTKAVSYQILAVTSLRRAGDSAVRYRLSCARQHPQDVPADATVHPWRLGVSTPRRASPEPIPGELASPLLRAAGVPDQATLARLQLRVPTLLRLLLEPVHRARGEAQRQEQARVARIGRDRGVVNLTDFGPSLRFDPVRGHDGAILREADVVIGEEPEEPRSRQRVRRARRADPIDTLFKRGSLSRRQHAAAGRLRERCEAAAARLPSGVTENIRGGAWSRLGITFAQLQASDAVRAALTEVALCHRPVLFWVVIGGGTLMGYTHYAHCHKTTASDALRGALDALGDFYFGNSAP